MSTTQPLAPEQETVTASPVVVPPSRWRLRLLIAAFVFTVLMICHESILKGIASGLVLEEPLDPTDAVILLGGDIRCDVVAALYQTSFTQRIIVLDDNSERVVRMGIIPPRSSITVRELKARGVPESALTTLPVTSIKDREWARVLGNWLDDNPDARATVLCGEFTTRASARILRDVLGAEKATRLRLRAVPDRRFDQTNWWHSRQGIVAVTNQYVALGYVYIKGENTETPSSWDPDQYEQTLRHGQR